MYFSGALSGNIDSSAQKQTPIGGQVSVQNHNVKGSADIFSNTVHRPRTGGNPHDNRNNFLTMQITGALSKGHISKFGHNQMLNYGASDMLYGATGSKISSDFKVLNNHET